MAGASSLTFDCGSDAGDRSVYSVSDFANNMSLIANRQFFAGDVDPVAATSGEFQTQDTITNVTVTGVYEAERWRVGKLDPVRDVQPMSSGFLIEVVQTESPPREIWGNGASEIADKRARPEG